MEVKDVPNGNTHLCCYVERLW